MNNLLLYIFFLILSLDILIALIKESCQHACSIQIYYTLSVLNGKLVDFISLLTLHHILATNNIRIHQYLFIILVTANIFFPHLRKWNALVLCIIRQTKEYQVDQLNANQDYYGTYINQICFFL